MPAPTESTRHMLASTVPNWKSFVQWEKALLEDAFRVSPEVDAVARRLLSGRETALAKVEEIHRYTMEEIQYEQDYENHIAGVKPHPAPVVVERGYGDCKDKAVLFITLARKAGIDVHFALVRTRRLGAVRKSVPMQQFNHAIVYVPAQEGIPVGRFFDPTADALDIDALRDDDPGTLSLVYDPRGDKHVWREIPYQGADVHAAYTEVKLKLSTDGSAKGTARILNQGESGAMVRKLARNAEQFAQVVQGVTALMFPGATVTAHSVEEVTDLTVPAAFRAEFEVKLVARREGDDLRLQLPLGWSPKRVFQLVDRRFPVVLGVPRTQAWRLTVELPEGATVKRLPSTVRVDSGCIALDRVIQEVDGTVVLEQQVTTACERIPVDQYTAQRAKGDEMLRVLGEELVLVAPLPPVAPQP